jgi:hypothetical protein
MKKLPEDEIEVEEVGHDGMEKLRGERKKREMRVIYSNVGQI